MSRKYARADPPVKRPYASPVRARRAAATRARILRAASRLFATQGYAATTVEEIATAAKVSRPTVFTSVGGKRDLISAARDVALAGDTEDTPVPERPWVHLVRDEPEAGRAIATYSTAMRTMHARAARLELAITAGAGADPELRSLADTSHEQRRFGCHLIAEMLVTKRGVAQDASVADVTDVLFVLASPEVFDLATQVRGWSHERYEVWLTAVLTGQILAERGPR